MKRTLLGLITTLILSSAALAADLPAKRPLNAPAPAAPSWSGFYVGIHGGGVWGSTDFAAGTVAADLGGYNVGAQLGYNWQVLPQFVLGIEGDVSHADINGGLSLLGGLASANQNVDFLWSVRGRLGFLPWQNVMVYATAGYAEVDATATVVIGGFSDTASAKHKGLVWGGGVETALASNWTLRAEILKYDLDNSTYAFGLIGNAGAALDLTTVRAAINYRF